MTRSLSAFAMWIGGLLAFGGWAFSAQPPNVVPSDGYQNTAMGSHAIDSVSPGVYNTAAGYAALSSEAGAFGNSAFGVYALFSTNGFFNNAVGYSALTVDSTGGGNNAVGAYALNYNTTASFNTAIGDQTLFWNSTGAQNTALGASALQYNVGGSGNIALGFQAGLNLTTGSNNIDIGNMGVAGESGTIRIGASGSNTATYIAGIARTPLEGSQVVISKNGQLGVLASSERFKTAIESMGPDSARMSQLRPVTFHLRTNPEGALQYGLIAEEVDKVYPELVIRDEAGRIQGVRYDELAPMLLNEIQLERKQLAAQSDTIAAQGRALSDMLQQFAELKAVNQAMQAALVKLHAGLERVAKL